MENKLTPELIEKARQAKSVEELLSIAKENEIELSELEAKAYFEQLNKSGELSDDELDNVSGGGCIVGSGGKRRCEKCGGKIIKAHDYGSKRDFLECEKCGGFIDWVNDGRYTYFD